MNISGGISYYLHWIFLEKRKYEFAIRFIGFSKRALFMILVATHVVVSVRHPITYQSPHPPPTNLANTLKIHTGENKIDH